MAIPKEPRQLMINLMYLVLTALLALNVSAEIFNAFKVVDRGLSKSNAVLDNTNERLPSEIARLAKKKEEFKVYADRAPKVALLANEFCEYVDGIVNGMIEETGGYLDEEKTEIRGYKDHDVTTRLLVNGGKGEELKDRLLAARTDFLEFVDLEDREAFMSDMAIDLDTNSWMLKNPKDTRSWADFTFNHMPLQATMPIFSKLKNDVKSTETAVLNYLLSKVGGEDVVLDKYQVVAVPKKSYVIKGEPYEAEIFLSASAGGSSNTGLSISAGGTTLPIEDGVAKYRLSTSSTGVKSYTASIQVSNPVTGEVNTYEGLFEYEVGERSVSVSADKMNVMYVGVDNPLSITAAGISSNEVRVSGSGSGIQLSKTSGGKYNAKVTSQGTATVTVSGGGLQATNYEFRTKLIPTPVPMLSNSSGGSIKNGVFKAQRGLIPVLENFDFDAKCNIVGFTLVRIPKTGDAIPVVNAGQAFTTQAKSVVTQATPGDRYLFENVKCQCPGWPAQKKLADVVFKIE